MTHTELVDRACRWLRNSCRLPNHTGYVSRKACSIVISELTTLGDEIPDAIGWNSGVSVLVECKVSRSDYYRDKRKPYRLIKPARYGLGNYRYYLTPPGLLVVDGLPEKWGLLETTGCVVKIIKLPEWQEASPEKEKMLLCSALRRMQETTKGDD